MSLSPLAGGGSLKGATGATGAAGPANVQVATLAADFTNATTTMGAVTGGGKALSVPVVSGHRYAFEAVLMINDSSGVDGVVFDWDASTCSITAFRYYADDGAGGAFGISSTGYRTTLAADVVGSGFGDDVLIMRGSIEPATSGDFALRAAQAAHTTGTLTIFRGSSLTVRETTE